MPAQGILNSSNFRGKNRSGIIKNTDIGFLRWQGGKKFRGNESEIEMQASRRFVPGKGFESFSWHYCRK
jgi:hypothetical protein